MMKKTFKLLNLLLIAVTLLAGYWYYDQGGLWRKGLASFGFVLVGLVNLVYCWKAHPQRRKSACWLAVGLVFSMAGDILLNMEFIPGAITFGVGHVCYFLSYCHLLPLRKRDWIPCGVIFAISAAIILLVPMLDFGSTLMTAVCLAYALVISLMTGKAVSNLLRKRGTVTVLLALGSLLFYFSDLMLVFHAFGNGPHIMDTLCLATYYPAQCILGASLFFKE